MPQNLDGKFYGIIHRRKDNQIEPPDSWMVFVARDNALPATLSFYYDQCKNLGCDQDQLDAIQELIRRVEQWRLDNPTRLKNPDVEPGELAWEL